MKASTSIKYYNPQLLALHIQLCSLYLKLRAFSSHNFWLVELQQAGGDAGKLPCYRFLTTNHPGCFLQDLLLDLWFKESSNNFH